MSLRAKAKEIVANDFLLVFITVVASMVAGFLRQARCEQKL